ncbi:hypothetical protein Dimus_030944 [Dionaea muscipula]
MMVVHHPLVEEWRSIAISDFLESLSFSISCPIRHLSHPRLLSSSLSLEQRLRLPTCFASSPTSSLLAANVLLPTFYFSLSLCSLSSPMDAWDAANSSLQPGHESGLEDATNYTLRNPYGHTPRPRMSNA